MVDLKAYIVTFNCGRALVEPNVLGKYFFDGWTDPSTTRTTSPDIVVLNLQEIAPIGYAFLGNNWVKPYFDRFARAIDVGAQQLSQGDGDESYVNVLSRNSGLTGLMIFAKGRYVDEIQSINVAEVGVGVSEMGNKGAIGARIAWKASTDESMYTTFVSAHLAPFEEEMLRRDQDYRQITERLVFSPSDARRLRKQQNFAEGVPLLEDDSTDHDNEDGKLIGIYSDDAYVFFAGDLNYRTGLSKPAAEDLKLLPQPVDDPKDPRHFSHLLEKDQLSQQLHDGKTLHGLSERPITFPPTYKYHTLSNEPVSLDEQSIHWNWATHRWPSWCDRILYAPSDMQVGEYSALPLFRTSDHRPVTLSVSIPLQQAKNSGLAKKAPGSLDPNYQARRQVARRKEIVVGIGAYLALTWEGNSLLLGAILMTIGATYLSKAMT